MGIQNLNRRINAYHWSNDWYVTAIFPSDWCTRNLSPALHVAVGALRAAQGSNWTEKLLSVAKPYPVLHQAFQEALADPQCSYALPERVIYPNSTWPITFFIYSPIHTDGYAIEVADGEQLGALRRVFSGEWMMGAAKAAEANIASQLFDAGAITPLPTASSYFDQPGIYRFQHSGALIVSRRAKILIDPVSHVLSNWGVRPECLSKIDAILISHTHKDHFCLATLLSFPRDTLFIVPKITRSSILSPDIASILRAAGFTRVRDAAWWTDIAIYDQIVHVLPFYGEQPWLRVAAANAEFRNNGNTYLIDFGPSKAWFLGESGQELGASMLDVAARVRDQAGAVDILLGNLSENLWTPWRANGAGTYLFCYDKVTLSSTQHWPDATSMSLGIEGMVEVMTRVSARFFLPHSHRFREPGKPIETEKFSERALMANLQHGCVRRNIATKLVEWKVLDGFLANPDGTFSISSCVEGRP